MSVSDSNHPDIASAGSHTRDPENRYRALLEIDPRETLRLLCQVEVDDGAVVTVEEAPFEHHWLPDK